MNQLIVISAPSATGKSTLINKLLEQGKDIGFIVSHTTRKQREGETNGVEYYFIEVEEFKKNIECDFFLEWKKVHDCYYGTSKSEIEKLKTTKRKVILDIDVQGALELKKQNIEARYIFIVPPSMGVLEERLRKRGTETESQIQRRLKTAIEELQYSKQWDYKVLNDSLEQAFKI